MKRKIAVRAGPIFLYAGIDALGHFKIVIGNEGRTVTVQPEKATTTIKTNKEEDVMLRFKKAILFAALVFAIGATGCGNKSTGFESQVEGSEITEPELQEEDQIRDMTSQAGEDSDQDAQGVEDQKADDQVNQDSDQEDQAVDDQEEDERQEEVAGNSFDSQELDDSRETSDQNEEDDVLAFLQEIRGNIFTDEQLYDIYGNIGEIVKNEYLDPNGIDHNAFKWPDSKDEDNAWVYLEYIITKYKTSGKLYNHEGFTDELPSEQNQQLMNSVLDGIISCNKLNEEFTVENIDQALLPIREKIPANVNFSD